MIQQKIDPFKWPGILAVAALLGLALVILVGCSEGGGRLSVQAVNGAVTIPASQVADGQAHFFQYASGGKDVVFFIVKGSDGTFHGAFDTCDVCFREKKGYVQDGSFMVCRNCNQKFAVDRINRVSGGGCNPTQLHFAQNGSDIVVRTDDLAAGARYF